MRLLICLYTALLIGANAALADTTAIEALRSGSLKKLSFHSVSKSLPEAEFTTAEGRVRTVSELKGKVILLNFWATWCAPCRTEMPMLSELQAQLAGPDFEVLTIATGRTPPERSSDSLIRLASATYLSTMTRNKSWPARWLFWGCRSALF
jgi:thiol-disulfide isomerase/thioredoxin